MLAIRIAWVMFLCCLMWVFCGILTGTWWFGLIVIAGLVIYAIADQNAKEKRVRFAYRQMIQA